MIDFRKEVEKEKENIINDLTGLIRINSELTTFDPNRIGAPFGEGIKESLEYMLDLAKRDGFLFENVDGYAGHIIYGEKKEWVGSIGHLDVVPAGNDWTFAPYGAVINDNKMYGRGTEDDKGPTLAFYYAMKILKNLNIPLSKRIKLILATDEETAWRGINYYFKKYPEVPQSGFIPDADFPLIYAEKGIANIVIEGKYNSPYLLKVDAGFRSNMVPDFCEVILANLDLNEVEKEYNQYLKINSYVGSVKKENNSITLRISGKSAHGSTPEIGVNAIHLMFSFLSKYISGGLVDIINHYFVGDTLGRKLGIKYNDDEMGDLTNNLGVLNYENNKFKITLNIRYPKGVNTKFLLENIYMSLNEYDVSVELEKNQDLLYVDPNSELVKKLMNVYIKHTGEVNAKPLVIGGGTFARAMPNVVAFGPHFLDKESFIHQKNEYIDLDDFFKAIVIYTEALYELAK